MDKAGDTRVACDTFVSRCSKMPSAKFLEKSITTGGKLVKAVRILRRASYQFGKSV